MPYHIILSSKFSNISIQFDHFWGINFWWYHHPKIVNDTINWIEIFEKLLFKYYKACKHVFNSQEPHWYCPNCLRLILGQSKALTLPNLCVICSRTNFHRTTREFMPGHAGNIDRDDERLSHRVRCYSLCSFLPRCD